jgi:glycosyltransferase involved in cell wall biosynthesis
LCFAGGGNAVTLVEEATKRNPNIQYLGYCTKEEVFDLQNKATVLVNPRSAFEEYTKYSFPSKTMEYLSMGKPVAMNKLPALPKEYEEHLFLFEEETAESMAKTFLQFHIA